MKRIVITGALGHIGSRLIRELPATFPGAEIVMVDNLATQRYPSVFGLPAACRYVLIEADVLTADLCRIFSGADAVVHLAAITDAAGSVEIPDRIEEVNFRGADQVAQACGETGSPLVFISTTSVYGLSRSVVDETCEDLQPQSPYAHFKLEAEKRLAELGPTRSLRFVTCRFGTVFGVSPGMRFHTAINKFVWQARWNLPLTVWRTALDQYRPYLDLDDAVRALSFVLSKRLFDRQIYNIVTANATVREVIEHIRANVPRLTIDYVDSPIMNQFSYTVSNEKFRALGFKFAGSLSEGIGETIRLLDGQPWHFARGKPTRLGATAGCAGRSSA